MFVMHPGPHAMLLVLRCDRRFTEEEYNVYLALKDIFGTNLSSFLIIVFTGRDELEREGHRFEDQIEDKSKCRSLYSILDDIGGRYILFNNRASEEDKEKQVDKLIEKVRELVQENGCIYFQHSFSSDLEEPVRQMIEEEMKFVDDNNCAEVSLKEKLTEHRHKLSVRQHQLYDTTAPDLESRIKEGMEKRTVHRRNQCSMM